MWLNPEETADLFTFTEEFLNRKLRFCAVIFIVNGLVYELFPFACVCLNELFPFASCLFVSYDKILAMPLVKEFSSFSKVESVSNFLATTSAE